MRWQLGMFDWDGTLFDSLDLNYGALTAVFSRFGLTTPSIEMWRNESVSDYYEYFWDHGVPKDFGPDQIKSIWQNYFETNWNQARLYDGARELLLLCQKLKISRAIVSSQLQRWIVRGLRENHVIHFLGYNIRGNVRDKEDALVEQLDCFGVKAENAFYLDDTLSGVGAAKNLGLTAIGITHGFNTTKQIAKAQPNFIADSLYDVIKIIQAGGGV